MHLFFLISLGWLVGCDDQSRSGAAPVKVPETFEEFMNAAGHGSLEEVGAGIVVSPQWVRQKNAYLSTPLHSAATYSPFTKVIEMLIENGADVNAKNIAGWTPLHCAIGEGGGLETAKILIARNADINVRDKNGNTPMHLAIYYGIPEFVSLLLSHHADLNIKNSDGLTALAYAVDRGGEEEAPRILQAFIDGNIGLNVSGRLGMPLLHEAIAQRYDRLIPILISGGIDLTEKNSDGQTALEFTESRNEKEMAEFIRKSLK